MWVGGRMSSPRGWWWWGVGGILRVPETHGTVPEWDSSDHSNFFK